MKRPDYFRIAAVVPNVRPAAVSANTDALIEACRAAAREGARLVLFPELALTGASCGDLFFQSRLVEEAETQLYRLVEGTAELNLTVITGMPAAAGGRLFNAAVVSHGGEGILGVVPKCRPDRWFASGLEAAFPAASGTVSAEVLPGGNAEGVPVLMPKKAGLGAVPWGTDLLFCPADDERAVFGVVFEDDSSRLAFSDARLIFSFLEGGALAGRAAGRRAMAVQQSACCAAAYVCVSPGPGESTTGMVFSGQALAAENGRLLSELESFPADTQILYADFDLELLENERRRMSSSGRPSALLSAGASSRLLRFGRSLDGDAGKSGKTGQAAGPAGGASRGQAVPAGRPAAAPAPGVRLYRPVDPHPFIPSGREERDERFREIAAIQAASLATRLGHTGIQKVVLGLSGGLDSTLALLVSVQAFERLGLPKDGIQGITMPGFGTSGRTLGNAERLCKGLGISLENIDIRPVCEAQMKDLQHSGRPEDSAYENIQARYRTALLMNRANMSGALVVGTGDLSELALGWCTYNGDHMSMYSVNAGVPKTLVRHLVRWAADTWVPEEVKSVLYDILDTPISPELLPPDVEGRIAQKTEEKIGPYELHDFFLYQTVRRGFGPEKTAFLAAAAFEGTYGPEEINKWLKLFYRRFFSQQFKRSCMPDGPKIGTVGLSPRGDWLMPSDAAVDDWLKELEQK